MSEENKTLELVDDELEKVSGGFGPGENRSGYAVNDVVKNRLYQQINNINKYAHVTGFPGTTKSYVQYETGTKGADGKIHKDVCGVGANYRSTVYTSFIDSYNVDSWLSSDNWVVD